MDLNFEQLHVFIEGMKNSRESHAEENKSYEYGLNGRLYSNNGVLSYSSIKGTVEIYNDPNIVKYLGFYAFVDELVVFVKYNKYATGSTTVVTTTITGQNLIINIPFGSNIHNFNGELLSGAEEIFNTVIEDLPVYEEAVLENNYEEVPENQTIDLSDYYNLSGTNIPNYEICDLSNIQQYEYNEQYSDAIIVFTKNGHHAFNARIAWLGKMNWDINRKITTVGIDENMYYKRVYFTDNLNPLRVFNLKDNKLLFRNASEFDIRQNSTMLQPEIKEITTGGSIKAMSVQYAYKLITQNGQTTKFSPFSPITYIVKDLEGYDFEGGAIDETTNTKVVIRIPIINLNYYEVQAVAIEFGTDTAIPTAIRNLGIKPISTVVEFTHNGNESEFTQNVTLEDITETGNTWTYCADITTKNNKLIAGGLRNEPYTLSEKYVQDLFLFKGYAQNGTTHDVLINPEPKTYRYIDPTNAEDSIYLKKVLFNRFLFFGNVTLTLNNTVNPAASQSISFESSADEYIEYIDLIWEWLSALDLSLFPNLQITRVNESILFSPIDDGIPTDMFDYYFTTSITQTIIDFDTEYGTLPTTVDTNSLVYGAQSIGFNQGTGVRVTFKEVKDPVLHKSPEYFQGGQLLDLETPSLGKTFVKGEIYRFSLQCFSKGDPLFSIILGDVYTPSLQDHIRGILNDGSIEIIPGQNYTNQSVVGATLFAHRLQMRVEVRIPCEFKQQIDSYQINYVERTEKNRTILCQGISGPLVRLIDWAWSPSNAGIAFAPNVYSKWTLPFVGGPLYSINEFGFNAYDDPSKGENYNEESGGNDERAYDREITNRRMFYFDSPDLIHERVSASAIKTAKLHVIGRLNSDASLKWTRSAIPDWERCVTIHCKYRDGWGPENQVLQNLAFSKKIGYNNLGGSVNLKPWVANVNIFSQLTPKDYFINVDKATHLLTNGEIVPSGVLGTSFEAVNSALSLAGQGAYNSGVWRSGHTISERVGGDRRYSSETGKSSQESQGYPTVFIRAEEDLFTDDFIGPHVQNPIQSEGTTFEGYNSGQDNFWSFWVECSDSHALINIVLDNEASIYGGRTRNAFSENEYIPLSKVIPIKGSESSNRSQIFTMEGDFFTTLFLRTKNDYSNHVEPLERRRLRQSPNAYTSEAGEMNDYNRGAAWAYGVVLETEVESRLMHSHQYYKDLGSIDWETPINELLNPGYYKKNDLRVYAPVPYNFKDDPLLQATLSASKVKLNGDYFDAWTEFPLNEFYELQKDKGAITNVTNWKDSIFSIQELETNEVFIDSTDFITTEEGDSVAINKGNGKTFTRHQKISDFGTSIRRALCEGELGFSFFDEYNNVFVKFGQSLSLTQELETKLIELFKYDKVIDSEGYYDVRHKETNIRLRTESGCSYMLSYNELLQKFNGWIAYDHDIYITFDKRVFAPCCANIGFLISCPQIFSDDTISVQIHQYFEYQIQATENPTRFSANNLPGGVQINTITGLVYGVIDVQGVYNITVFAENEECYDSLDIIVTANIDQLYGTIIGIAIVTGFLSGRVPIEGVSNGSATVTGTMQYAHSPIVGVSNGVATVTATIIGRVDIFGEINAGATVTGTGRIFNFFVGGAESLVADENVLATHMDAGNFMGSTIAWWVNNLGPETVKWERNYNHGPFPYIDELQVFLSEEKAAFYIDTFYIKPEVTWVIDLQGKITRINQGAFRRCVNMEWMYFPNVRSISGPSGYFTLEGLTGLLGYLTFPEWRGLDGTFYPGVLGPNNMNHIFNNALNVTTLYTPKLEYWRLQWSNRSALMGMTALKRWYAPLLKYTDGAAGRNHPSYDPAIDPLKDMNIAGGTTCGPGKVFYLHPDIATIRKADVLLRVFNNVVAGDTLTINGLTYTAVNGPKSNYTEFRCDFPTAPNSTNQTHVMMDIRDSINNDTRIGDYADVYAANYLQSGNVEHAYHANLIIQSTEAGSASNVITCSTTSAGLVLSAGTLNYGGSPDRHLQHWIDEGTDIRYVTNFEAPFAITDLSADLITTNSCRLNFSTPPLGFNPIDFYEVWIEDGKTFRHLFVPHQEITGSGELVLNLEPGTKYKIKVVTRDYLYNGSPFSNVIEIVTLL